MGDTPKVVPIGTVDARDIPLLSSAGQLTGYEMDGHHARGVKLLTSDERRMAFEKKDVEASKTAHQQILGAVPYSTKVHLHRNAVASSDFLRALVFGGLDGIATIFATIAGCLGAKLSPTQTVIVSMGNLLANAISMGLGEFLSCHAEDEFIDSERQREEWEVENCPEEEKREMVEIYELRYGFSREDAELVINTSFKYKEFFISHMMAEELGLLLPDTEGAESPGWGSTPFTRGFVMFGSFILFGLIPLLAFFLINFNFIIHTHLSHDWSFAVTAFVSCLTLFCLGVLKSQYVAHETPWKAGMTMLLNGGGAGLVAFAVGSTLQRFAGATVLD